ncbi:unnamed protein product [Notodromas monacha]|uniref:Polypeptide N-acetylgalactosaminyltransferase n=1 Tax=Notodromas monacha TaxID=399045 RepID=A0A7R9BLD2_9CRUS|nr:unnamed protein product [Notodromas monacha]CAG0917354.1 unnamed protein product [Notodromas monacha]
MRSWLARRKSTLKIVLATSVVWTAVIHTILFFVLQSDLPLCLIYGFSVCSDHDRPDDRNNNNNKYAEFLRQMAPGCGINEDCAIIADTYQDQLEYPIRELSFWAWSEVPGGGPRTLKTGPWSLGDRGERISLEGKLKKESEKRFGEHEFDVVISDSISVQRSIPDSRSLACQARRYSQLLPNASVIICFHNEAWSALSRSLWSVVNRTPRELLKEIILVDDASYFNYTYDPRSGQSLQIFAQSFTNVTVRLLRSDERLGLVKARLLGARNATGQTLVFLDSHVECNRGWLPPLLERILASRSTIACPVIDVVSHVDFSYVSTNARNRGGFNWNLDFYWFPAGADGFNKNNNKRRGTPVMAGGIYAIDAKYFWQVGAYDEGMSIWGSENIEMSIRVWTCGGRIEIIPCSRVGHIFRGRNPVGFPEGVGRTVNRNKARVADVWLDDHANLFYGSLMVNDLWDDKLVSGDLAERFELRKRMNCHSFRWYLETVFPESKFPIDLTFIGSIELHGSDLCLGSDSVTNEVMLSRCRDPPGRRQLFVITGKGHLVQEGVGLQSTSTLQLRMSKSYRDTWNFTGSKIILTSTSPPLCLASNVKSSTPSIADCGKKLGNKWNLKKFSK